MISSLARPSGTVPEQPAPQQPHRPPHARTVCEQHALKEAADVRWAHAVNSLEALNGVVRDGNAHFCEADVTTSADGVVPVMAHGADEVAAGPRDSLAAWLRAVVSANVHRSAQGPLGAKLDFKDGEAVRLGLDELAALREELGDAAADSTPVWLNADVLRGPNGRGPGVDADEFCARCLRAEPAAVLSLGWTQSADEAAATRLCGRDCWPLLRAAGAPGGAGGYSDGMVDSMLEVCERYRLTQVTFAVRYRFVERSAAQMRRLLNHCPSYSLTVFTSAGDPPPDREWLARELPAGRVFLDAP